MRGCHYWASAFVVTLALASAGGPAKAQIVYDDTVDPDLSNNYLAPTQFDLGYGVNSFTIMTSLGTGALEIDFMRIDLPVGGTLTHINLADWVEMNDNGTAFLAFQAEPAFTFNPDQSNGGDQFACLDFCLGYTHFGPDVPNAGIGDNLLFPLAENLGGFDIPLTDPTYTFWIQDNTAVAKFQLDFVVSIPGDYNGDLVVNAADYVVWRNTLEEDVFPVGLGADGDRDGTVDRDDYLLWKTTYGLTLPGYGEGAAASNTIPEPSSGLLILLSVAILGGCQANRKGFRTTH